MMTSIAIVLGAIAITAILAVTTAAGFYCAVRYIDKHYPQ